ncbi:SAM-dependent methyltransferase [Levilactobacillus tangyuanensis]|uniref:SAM-dependent methyltransferase n=1 Tax=Levilactobacillus tangyuanensis TaxID=2486021 RepID=A0ABW1TN47_9LACO|nr:SAM-dependent methyltransferase [Levilactobacillus tangyuanensis]
MNPKKLRRLKKQVRHQPTPLAQQDYLSRIKAYYRDFGEYSAIKALLSNIILADRILSTGKLPQQLPLLQLPDDTQDVIFQHINATYPAGDPTGDQLWNHLTDLLPQLDHDLRSFRDYLENHYGMWAYTSEPVVNDLAEFVGDRSVLEVMAGNGYISKGLRDAGKTVYATDSQSWTAENETGRHTLTPIEPLTALEAFEKYQNDVGVVVMSWSPDGVPVDWELLQAIRASAADVDFVVIGEKDGATDSAAFWQHAELLDNPTVHQLNRHFTPIDLVRDQVYLVK